MHEIYVYMDIKNNKYTHIYMDKEWKNINKNSYVVETGRAILK